MPTHEEYAQALETLEEIGADPDTTYLQETIYVVLNYVAQLEESNRLRDLVIVNLKNLQLLYQERDEYRLKEISQLRRVINPSTNK